MNLNQRPSTILIKFILICISGLFDSGLVTKGSFLKALRQDGNIHKEWSTQLPAIYLLTAESVTVAIREKG